MSGGRSTLQTDFGEFSLPVPLQAPVRVLVAEDEPVQALVLRLFLERLGIAVVQVGNGEQAVEAVRSQQFAMVLMDYVMPVLDGIEATRRIRRWEQTQQGKRLPIVAVTASAMTQECERYVEAGMDDVLVKPFAAADLRRVVTRCLWSTGACAAAV